MEQLKVVGRSTEKAKSCIGGVDQTPVGRQFSVDFLCSCVLRAFWTKAMLSNNPGRYSVSLWRDLRCVFLTHSTVVMIEPSLFAQRHFLISQGNKYRAASAPTPLEGFFLHSKVPSMSSSRSPSVSQF